MSRSVITCPWCDEDFPEDEMYRNNWNNHKCPKKPKDGGLSAAKVKELEEWLDIRIICNQHRIKDIGTIIETPESKAYKNVKLKLQSLINEAQDEQ